MPQQVRRIGLRLIRFHALNKSAFLDSALKACHPPRGCRLSRPAPVRVAQLVLAAGVQRRQDE